MYSIRTSGTPRHNGEPLHKPSFRTLQTSHDETGCRIDIPQLLISVGTIEVTSKETLNVGNTFALDSFKISCQSAGSLHLVFGKFHPRQVVS